uniref:Uncharacterized protein n=1 Tax=Aegilops tauschii TaxID=37682 RepID=M8B3E3_AEGTA
MARWNEIKELEDEKWKAKSAAKVRKFKADERRLALEEERIRDAKKAKERAMMFMNPNTMDETARKYCRGGGVDDGGRGGGVDGGDRGDGGGDH